VPAAVKSKGTLTVASDATYAPNEFIGSDGHTVIGMDADLAHALFPLLGLKANVVNATFDTIIPGLTSGKFDIGMSSFTDTKARQAQVNFVDYFVAGESFFGLATTGTTVTSLAQICGLKVAVESGTTEQMDAQAAGKKCVAAGKPTVTVLTFPDQNAANLAVASARAQLGFSDSPVAEYQVKQSHGKFKLIGPSLANAPYGIAVPKTSGTLPQAILAALNFMVKNGQYQTILKKWGIEAGALKTPTINGATS
jgi:polar amino acid transport system substrate-binding protein